MACQRVRRLPLADSENRQCLIEQTGEISGLNWGTASFIRQREYSGWLPRDFHRDRRDKFEPLAPLKLCGSFYRAREELANRTVIFTQRRSNRSVLFRCGNSLSVSMSMLATTRRLLRRSVRMRALLLVPVVVTTSQCPMQPCISQQRNRRVKQKHGAKDEPSREHSREPFVPQVCTGHRSLGNSVFVENSFRGEASTSILKRHQSLPNFERWPASDSP